MSEDQEITTGSKDPLVGLLIDEKIELLERIGKGAFGTVYKGRHRLLDTFVAVKVLDRGLFEDQLALERFKKEAQVLSTFSHENIVRCLSLSSLPDKRSCMVLEFVEGKTLAEELLEQGAWTSEKALPVFEQICAGLAYAHARGIIHRDLKPENIMICGSGAELKVKILDFGIFKAIDPGAQGRTKTGMMLGSVNYMSPEQCKAQSVDQRSDIYSLACLMYEILSGKPPLQGESDMLTMSNHVNTIVKSVPAKHIIPKELEAIVLNCLEKEPGKRYASAEDLRKALLACPRTSVGQKSKQAKLLKPLFIAVSAVLALAALGFLLRPTKKDTELKIYRHGLGPIIQEINNDQDLQKAEEWITTALRDHPETKADELGRAYNISADYRSLKKMGIPPQGPEILSNLDAEIKQQQQKKTKSLRGLYYLYRVRSVLLIVLGQDNEAMKQLTIFGKPAGDEEGTRNKEYCYCIEEILRILKANNNVALEEKVLNKFQIFAESSANRTIKALMHYFKADFFDRSKQKEKARTEALLSAQNLSDNTDLSVEFPPFSVNMLCNILASLGEDTEALRLIIARLDNLKDKSTTVSDSTAKMKLLAAEIYKRRKEFDLSELLATDLIEQCLRDIPENQISDSVELLLLDLVHNGKRPHGGATLVGAVKSEAHRYLRLVLAKCPSRFRNSVSVVLNRMASLGVNRGWLWEQLEKDIDKSNLAADDKAGLRIEHLDFLERTPDANRESNIKKQARNILQNLEEVQDRKIKHSTLEKLERIFTQVNDKTSAEECAKRLRNLPTN